MRKRGKKEEREKYHDHCKLFRHTGETLLREFQRTSTKEDNCYYCYCDEDDTDVMMTMTTRRRRLVTS